MNSPQESRTNRYTVLSTFNPVESLLEIKRSEFIGIAQRVTSEEAARAFIDAMRKQYHDARHVCSAFVIGPDRDVQRSSDDGEPAGTAGIPMLQALLARRTTARDGGETTDLSDLAIVVVRYFGGIKLGAGGLVRAYTDAVVQVLDEATLVPRERLRLGVVPASFADAGKLENDIRNHNINVLRTEYGAKEAEIIIGVFDESQVKTAAEEAIATLTAGSAEITWGETDWV